MMYKVHNGMNYLVKKLGNILKKKLINGVVIINKKIETKKIINNNNNKELRINNLHCPILSHRHSLFCIE